MDLNSACKFLSRASSGYFLANSLMSASIRAHSGLRQALNENRAQIFCLPQNFVNVEFAKALTQFSLIFLRLPFNTFKAFSIKFVLHSFF